MSRGPSGFVLAGSRETYLVSTKDSGIGRDLFTEGEFDFAKLPLCLRILGKHQVGLLIDVGANVGSVCIPAVTRGLAKRAVALEPEELNYFLLTVNVRMNGVQDKIDCVRVAATSTGGSPLLMELSPSNLGDHRVARPNQARPGRLAVEVPQVRLDDVVQEPLTGQALLWIDVQGFEIEVLRAAKTLLEANVPLVLEFWPAGMAEQGNPRDLLGLVEGYEQFVDLSRPWESARPITQLGDLFRRYDGETFTDILIW